MPAADIGLPKRNRCAQVGGFYEFDRYKMERRQIIGMLKESHASFVSYIDGLTPEQFSHRYQQKWTAGQQLSHIYLAVRPLVLALGLPKLLIRLAFGKANRPGRTYEELVRKYQSKLESGGKSSKAFIPKVVTFDQKEGLIKALNNKTYALCSGIENFTEQELDTLVLPHPLLGKVTLREMLYFTIYHVGHHHQATSRNLHLSN